MSGLGFDFLAVPSRLSALVDKALSLDGIDDFVETPDTPALHMGDELSITGWFRVDDLDGGSSGWQDLFWKGDAPDRSPYTMREYSLQLYKSGYLLLTTTPESRRNTGDPHMQTPRQTIVEGQWYHFGAVISASQNLLQIYVNGQLQSSEPFDPTGMRDTGGSLRLGGLPGRDFFGGLPDEVQFWNRALSRAEIERSMNQTLTGMEQGLVAYYDFDELDAYEMVPDRSGNGHRLYLRNGARIVVGDVNMLPFARLGADKPMGGVPTRDLFLRSLSLDGHGDYLEIPNAAQLHFGGAMTIEGWLRPEGLAAARQGIFFKGAAPHLEPFPNLEYSLWLRNGGHLQLASTPQGHSGKLALETSIPAIRVG